MRNLIAKVLMICVGLALFAGVAQAAEIINTNITQTTTWTADKTYDLQATVYVTNGASLYIEPGTVIASTATPPNGAGALIVTRGSRIYAQGNVLNPIIFTSSTDVATWDVDASHPTGKDPKSGTWHEGCNEWGNLTLCGNGYIAEDDAAIVPPNLPYPASSNYGLMEGLIEDGSGKTYYGGGNDYDDSGSIEYVSIRYGGRVPELQKELNGLSLGGIGKETDINHVEIMNNVDDGIEIWGGCVNLKYVSIWNIGDDSFDIDQGWRGTAQFGLIVQGYSRDASSGSGVGDNCIETDGAENSNYQPVTTSTCWNFTVVGQPGLDHGTAWRDSARMQYHNFVFMDLGQQLVKFDNIDGDGGAGYGFDGTLTWENTWTTAYNAVPAHPNDPPSPPANLCPSPQTAGYLAQITDSLFFNNLNASAYTEATARGVFNVANNNAIVTNYPITTITRGPLVVKGGKNLLPVTYLDPRPANDAVVSDVYAPSNGFFTEAKYHGAFAPGENWLYGWSATYAYGMTPQDKGAFWADNDRVSSATGGIVNFDLNAGAANAGRNYLILACLKGQQPGLTLPMPGGSVLPIQWDGLTDKVLTSLNTPTFFNFLSALNGSGQATAQFKVNKVSATKIGKTLTFAYLLEGTPTWDFVSNAVEVKIVP